MATTFVSRLEPSSLEGYERGKPHDEQPLHIPKIFLDAMEVRESVFVNEQKVPLENELDADDARSCHWVVYASVNKTEEEEEEEEVRDDDGSIIQPRKSSARTTPVGTIRVVPFPHEPHPKAGAEYWGGHLSSTDNQDMASSTAAASSTTAAIIGPDQDRETTLHDGREPYLKLGRLAVSKAYRGNGLSTLLVQTVLAWLRSNPSFFDPSITELRFKKTGASTETDIPKWCGLICIHAQKHVVGVWEKWGFVVDQKMGLWWEEGIPHVGMFKRLEFTPTQRRI
ncbi:hypothetical protein E4U21_004390 [Claviceps maximensis]|nr:hypothetical protein E4U21_004390 [Claviceps maximensis]